MKLAALLCVLPVLAFAGGTNGVTGRLTGSPRIDMLTVDPKTRRSETGTWSTGGYTIQGVTGPDRPQVWFMYCYEGPDKKKTVARWVLNDQYKGTWKDYKIADHAKGSLVIVWRIELRYKGEVLDYATFTSDPRLQYAGLTRTWWQ